MGSVLIIAEKPSQAQAYFTALNGSKKHDGYFEIPKSSIFPDGAKLTYAIGHLITLFEPHDYEESLKNWSLDNLPIIPTKFKFKVSSDKIKQFNIVKKLLDECNEIIIGTDCDREGESIARLIINQAGASHKPTKRLWINSLEDDEIIKGFKNLKDGKDYIHYSEEAQARQISDWLVGLNTSRLYSLLLFKKGVKGEGGRNVSFSVGRVQTPTLKLIYDRQKEIENFKPKPFFELESLFSTNSGTYKGRYKGKYDSKNEVQDLLRKSGISSTGKSIGEIKDVKKEVKKTPSPQLFSLSSLQVLANKKFRYSPNQVLKIVQSLYDNPLKLVTYPRTDTPYITDSEFAYLKDNLSNYQKLANQVFEPHSLEPNKRYVNSKKVQEHYAIVPTKKIPSDTVINSLTIEQKNIYFEILKSALGMFHAPYVYEETTIVTTVNELPFETKGKIEKSKGWKEMFLDDPKDEDNEELKESLLPDVSSGMKVESMLQIKEGKTTKPKQYTEGDLIPLMRDCGKKIKEIDEESKAILNEVEGLGTEATRSNIIEGLKKQKYIEVKKNKVFVTKKGEILCQAVEGTLLAKPELTAKWESYLKKIGKGEGDKKTFILNTINFTKSIVENTKQSIEFLKIDSQIQAMQSIDNIALCPTCKKGHIIEKKEFYGCTEYKNGCKQTFPKKKNDKSLTKTQIKQLCEKGKTSKIKGFKKKDSTDKFEAFLELKDGKVMFAFK
ncbi:type IA DNA topoisomerase [Heyndrickxia sporothermodurans]|uniref:DNA topoisomerase n=1 Tax=Heyndrickxia sporothermodurans TaxID=46224 RepID=A0AB37HC15_9BACI|nr:type IA DNA topoisomerase [Heyndrickxia sporothermodurans]MBL5768669.1 DNA topoisomerase 3 [Heyndrickxia sporothermodurans]MBL5772387.1 DNA topoisomerase 3 [Heyndrickxia sporothermodurans]MBL5775920.1 DNA topoisomerase 3 [Heyndrickxia sporothermodurans]MBL5779987.1 DNA topoisomerase 3 [Heyndrickxia sporothermodurans]MBL5782809.1 DNA topoisomerase 3 [Heyndrickxia sporothermodurans]